jgi:hypothetical protein
MQSALVLAGAACIFPVRRGAHFYYTCLPNFMVFAPCGAIFRGIKIRILNNISMLIFRSPM